MCEVVFALFLESVSFDKKSRRLQRRPIKLVLDIICLVLVHIYILSLSTGVLPKESHMAKIPAIFKDGDKNTVTNSLTPRIFLMPLKNNT